MEREPEGAGQVVPAGQDGITCPFLRTVRETLESSGERVSHLCLSRTNDPITISGRYVEAFCLTDQHLSCSLFIHADEEAKRLAYRTRAAASMVAAPESRDDDETRTDLSAAAIEAGSRAPFTAGQMEPDAVARDSALRAAGPTDGEVAEAQPPELESGTVAPAGSGEAFRVIRRFLHRRAGPEVQHPEPASVTPSRSEGTSTESETLSPGQARADAAAPEADSPGTMNGEQELATAVTPEAGADEPVEAGSEAPSIMQSEPASPERTEHEFVAPGPAAGMQAHAEPIGAELLDPAIQQPVEFEPAYADPVAPRTVDARTTPVEVATPPTRVMTQPAQVMTPHTTRPDHGTYRVVEPKPIEAEGEQVRAEPAQVEVAQYDRSQDAQALPTPSEPQLTRPQLTTKKATSEQQVLPLPVAAAREAEAPHYIELPEREARDRAAQDAERTAHDIMPAIAREASAVHVIEGNALPRKRASGAPEVEAVHLVEPPPEVRSLSALPAEARSLQMVEAEETGQAGEREPGAERSTEAGGSEGITSASTPPEVTAPEAPSRPEAFAEPPAVVDEVPLEYQPDGGREDGPRRTLVAVIAVFLICVFIVALLVFLLINKSHSASRAVSPQTSVPTGARVSGRVTNRPTVSTSRPTPSRPAVPAARRAWHFLPLSTPADAVVLMFSNKNPYPVIASVRLAGRQGAATRITIPANSGTQLELAPQAAVMPLVVRTNGRIVVGRMVIKGTKTHFSYGLPGR